MNIQRRPKWDPRKPGHTRHNSPFQDKFKEIRMELNELYSVHNTEVATHKKQFTEAVGKLNESMATIQQLLENEARTSEELASDQLEIDILKARIDDLEADEDGRTRPTDPPVEPPTDPPVEPPTDPPVEPPTDPPVEPPTDPPLNRSYPDLKTIYLKTDIPYGVVHTTEFKFFESALFEDTDSDITWRYGVIRHRIGGMMFVSIVEQFEGFNATRVTVIPMNVFKERGAVLFDTLQIKYGTEDLIDIAGDQQPGKDAFQVRGGFPIRRVFGPDAWRIRNYDHLASIIERNATELPPWCRKWAKKGLNGAGQASRMGRIGIYNIFLPEVSGSHSWNGSHGGQGVSPNNFGVDGWQNGSPEGFQWAETSFLATWNRSPVGVYDSQTLMPHQAHDDYWTGRGDANKPGGVSAPIGYAPDVNVACPYLAELEEREAFNGAHGSRSFKPAEMLAPYDIAARIFLVEWMWHDSMMAYDGPKETYLGVYKSIREIIRTTTPHAGSNRAGRDFAHSGQLMLASERYWSNSSRGVHPGSPSDGYRPDLVDSFRNPAMVGDEGVIDFGWKKHWSDFIKHVAQDNGILFRNIGYDDAYGNVGNPTRAREVQLGQIVLLRLGLSDIAANANSTMSTADNGDSVSAAFDATQHHWSDGEHSVANYFPLYDILMGHLALAPKTLDEPTWQSVLELPIALTPRAWVKKQVQSRPTF